MFFRATIIVFYTITFFCGSTVEAKQDSLQLTLRDEKIASQTDSLIKYYNTNITDTFILVNIDQQQLLLVTNNVILKTYVISTAKEGVGSEKNSNKTPLGVHRIKNKIGNKAAIGTVFFNTLPSRQVAKIYTDTTDTPKDYITTRIMWLDGQEPGKNKGDGIDSYERCIYIHGTHEEGLLGRPVSMGCIRMKNTEVIELFNLVKEGTIVVVVEAL